MALETDEERYGRLKEVLSNSKELAKQIGGTIGEDLNSCIKSLDRLSEHLHANWKNVWHKGTPEAAQKKRTWMVCNNMRDALYITLEIIDHNTGGKLIKSGGVKAAKVPKRTVQATIPSQPPLPSSSQSLEMNDVHCKADNEPKLDAIMDPPPPSHGVKPNTSLHIVVESDHNAEKVPKPAAMSQPFPSPPVSQPSPPVSQQLQSPPAFLPHPSPPNVTRAMPKEMIFPIVVKTEPSPPKEKFLLPVQQKYIINRLHTPVDPVDQRPLIVVDKSQYFKLRDMYNDAVRRLDQLTERLKATGSAANDNARCADNLRMNMNQMFAKNVQLRLVSEEALKLIGDISREPCFMHFTEYMRYRVRKILTEHLLPSDLNLVERVPRNGKMPIFRRDDGGARNYVNQNTLPSLQWHSTSGSDNRRFICFVCGVIVTDPSSTLSDPATMRDNFSRMNPSQLQQLQAATNMGGRGIAVVCKSHSPEDWIHHLQKQQQQSIFGVKRPHEDVAGPLMDTDKQVKEEIVEEKKIKIEEEE